MSKRIPIAIIIASIALVAAEYSLSGKTLGKRYDTQGEKTFVFSPTEMEWAAYDAEGYYVAGGVANGGADYCHDIKEPCQTPEGVYRIYRKGGYDCESSTFPLGEGGAPMPYCMFFHQGYAIHGSPYLYNRNTSHGCVRVETSAAEWLHSYFLDHGTKVVIHPY